MIDRTNQYNKIIPYRAHNMLIKKLEKPSLHLTENISQPENSELIEQQPSDQVGYINVGVYTASGALPVNEAVVTVYKTDKDKEEQVLYHLISDESGRVPTIEVPVNAPLNNQYDYSTYNLRVQAIGYYTVNILDLQVFPNISTDYRINLIPVPQGTKPNAPGETVTVPQR